MERDSPPSALPAIARALLPLTIGCVGSLAYWAGLVTWDSLRQYDQALSGEFDDWHPPAMEWVWRQLLPLAHGPAPMLALQLGLYALGFVLLIVATVRAGRGRRALAIGCVALLPLSAALMATIIKDSLMAGALLSAVGLCALADQRARGQRALRVAAFLLLLFASMLRFNAVFATLPLALWTLPPAWRQRPWRLVAGGAVMLALLAGAMPLANRLTGAKPSGVELSLIIFDLGGITRFSGEDQFPPLGMADAVAVNRRCYNPVKWDSYAWWVDTPCPIGFERVRGAFARQHIEPHMFWLAAILRHPFAYAEHRLAHWNIETRLLAHDSVDRPVQVVAPPNEWGFAVRPNAIVRAVDWLACRSGETPLGWPCVWIALLIGLLWAGATGFAARVLAWSGLLYALGYAPLGVAAELRYYLWTTIAAALALVLGTAGWGAVRGKWARLAGPPVIVAAAATGFRLLS
ncbi:hypothetical protein ACM61V_06650 [Sphingomonas sp. TX0543]|uniref:hypothetical protein n=1 Tax=unclassified Sphingomonas TaxID=196159 RepID=UPI002016410A|nr:hypothetical protein [Sphingomonas sp. 3P27F8]